MINLKKQNNNEYKKYREYTLSEKLLNTFFLFCVFVMSFGCYMSYSENILKIMIFKQQEEIISFDKICELTGLIFALILISYAFKWIIEIFWNVKISFAIFISVMLIILSLPLLLL